MIRRAVFSWKSPARSAMRLRFSNKEEAASEEERKRDRQQRPELSAFDQANYEEIKKQIKDTNQPFVVQNREEQLHKMKERSTKLNLKQFELAKNEEYFKEDASIARPKGVMDFFDPRFSLKPGSLMSLQATCS
jgi:hypothetical protein